MASRTVARRSAVSELSTLLDSPEMVALIRDVDGLKLRKRRGYGTRALIGACLVRTMYALPTWTRTADLIADHEGLQRVIDGAPSHWACYRFITKLRGHSVALAGAVDRLAASLRAEHPDYGVDVAIDASDMAAYANGQRFVRNGGPERERFSDPDASWGHRSAVSTRKGGGFYGFKLHLATCTRTGLPLAWRVETARRSESLYCAPLLDAIQARGFQPKTCAMDKGYDSNRVHAECAARGVLPVIPRRVDARHRQTVLPLHPDGSRNNPIIPRNSKRFTELYRGRSAVEREFGRLKNEYALTPIRTRGLNRVRIHADLVLIARLGQALARARAVSLAA